MKSRFIAIGVGQGDAFFLEKRAGFAALVDGGGSVAGFAAEFQRATQRDSVDAVICTHNDADHANGVIGFLQQGLRCKEVWLPASWTDRLRDLFRPEEFTREIVDDVMKLGEREDSNVQQGDTLLERLAERHEANQVGNTQETLGTENLVEGCLEASGEEHIGLWHYLLLYWHPDWPFFWPRLWADDPRFRLFVEAIAAGDRIRQIARLAFHRGCRIRWFEYSSSNASGGNRGVLVPVNAREVREVTVNKSSALMYLALSIANRQSLVFCSSPDGTAPAILFTADSDLSFANPVPWSYGMIVTAPHHGSEANAKAYERFHREMRNSTSTAWVRSDGKFRSRPGKSFLDLQASNVPVFCTLCRHASQPKQDLVFTMRCQRWNPVNARACLCR